MKLPFILAVLVTTVYSTPAEDAQKEERRASKCISLINVFIWLFVQQ